MREVGARFERIGRAILAERWELADYDADELAEIDLTWSHHREVAQLGATFHARLIPELAAAISHRDRDQAARAFATTAAACNACHVAAKMAFIEISSQLGAAVPVVEASR